MRALAPDVWVHEQPLSVMGVELGARMTVVRLADGRLLVHSPTALDPALHEAIEALGEVAFVVAPNRWHHLFAGPFVEAFPNARLLGPASLADKRADLRFDALLDSDSAAPFRDELDFLLVGGAPIYDELVFFHRPSATLILTDVAVNVGPEMPLATRALFRAMGGYGQLGWSLPERLLFLRDRDAFAASLRRVEEWPFERVVVAHGAVVSTGARAAMAAHRRRCS